MNTDGAIGDDATLRASEQDGTYPRPQLMRAAWCDLSGEWGFRFDDQREGIAAAWYRDPQFDHTITVPFPPESPASGVNDPGYHPVAWYQRELSAEDLAAAGDRGDDGRILLHFGAVDYRCQAWLNGIFLGGHEGGHTPFQLDITQAIDPARTTQILVVRAEDEPLDVSQPRGKQDWLPEPHSIWYQRTTGIWQTVWLEAVPALSIESLHWVTDIPGASVQLALRLNRWPDADARVQVELSYAGECLGTVVVQAAGAQVDAVIPLPRQRNGQGYERLLWAPEHPRLIDAQVTLLVGDEPCDTVASYLGLRSVAVARGAFLLNDRPYYMRSVLSQGYWPDSHLAAPSVDALRAEAQLIKDLGFNAARVHQKVEDPRFLFWADKLGLLLWGEMPSTFEFTTASVTRTMAEWTEVIDRDLSHPSIVTWVPLNESWGVQHIAHTPAMRDYARGLYHLTRALDPSRPVISNDGWEHLESDIWSVHDYEASPEVMRERYADEAAMERLFAGMGPAGRRIRLTGEPDQGQPVMLTEFGGIQFSVDEPATDAWGYSQATSVDDFAERVGSLLEAVRSSGVLAGFCYTQLTDTMQEANGLCDENRVPKLPAGDIARMMGGAE
ncbi:glycoside hydrolase family 2 protein [Cryobacterium tepidiphilum]|uniref:Glycoside hydrolase family 2 n=1 Tax=Cryobacterium tepidiphilum TaxID=2486026 RepID=A0A3M8LQW0_9MICO|nr:glycoside hydrolase family 2 TIM barrel-domain containing protein [Cryobacterium tepidiphilum]RNE67259.1 glycoside hydrolase family 2 [Cryobacterium tepidiphilum]